MSTAVARDEAPRTNVGNSPEAASVRALERLAILEAVIVHEMSEGDTTLLGGLRFMLSDIVDDIVAMTPAVAPKEKQPDDAGRSEELRRDLVEYLAGIGETEAEMQELLADLARAAKNLQSIRITRTTDETIKWHAEVGAGLASTISELFEQTVTLREFVRLGVSAARRTGAS